MVEVLGEAEAFIHTTYICSVKKDPKAGDNADFAGKKDKRNILCPTANRPS